MCEGLSRRENKREVVSEPSAFCRGVARQLSQCLQRCTKDYCYLNTPAEFTSRKSWFQNLNFYFLFFPLRDCLFFFLIKNSLFHTNILNPYICLSKNFLLKDKPNHPFWEDHFKHLDKRPPKQRGMGKIIWQKWSHIFFCNLS